jgi:RNA-binding protein
VSGGLSGKQRRKLRALGHHLEVVVQVGQQGLTPGVLAAVEQALFDHELIKVRVPEGRERRDVAEQLARETGAEVAQVLGRTALLFKKREEDSKFEDLGA